MKSKSASGIMLTLLLIGILALAFDIQPVKAEPATWTVDDDGPANFHTIQEAINAASDGDTILVASGTYYENVVVGKSISLVGENAKTTIIDGRRLGKVVHITSHNVVFRGFSVQNSSTPYLEDVGILVDGSSGNDISNNVITNNLFGIWLENSSNNRIHENNIMAHDNGVRLWDSSMNTISHNNIKECFQGSILLHESCKNTICYNNLTNNQRGISLQISSSENIIYKNNIANNDYGIMFFEGSSGNTICNNNILKNNRFGLYFEISSENLIYHNNLVDNSDQVYWQDSTNIWDDGYPSGGNYWSDYLGTDNNGDGIGDTPYVINQNNRDNYPLVYTWNHQPWDKSAAIVDPVWEDVPNDGLISNIIQSLEYAGYTVSEVKKGTAVTIEWLKTGLRHGVVFWRGHGEKGAVLPQSYALWTCEEVTPETETKYQDDFYNGRVKKSSENHWGFTSKFIQHYYGQNRFQYSLIYTEACYGLKFDQDGSMADAFIDCGAGAYVGYGSWILGIDLFFYGGDVDARRFFYDTCRKGYTVKQALLHVLANPLDPFNSLDLSHDSDENLKLNSEISDTSSIGVVVRSPAEIFLTDPFGRHVGMDTNIGQVVIEVPDAIYLGGPEYNEAVPRMVWIPLALDGTYDIFLIGTGSGSYELTVGVSSLSETNTESQLGTITANQIVDFEVAVSGTNIILNPVSPVGGKAIPINIPMNKPETPVLGIWLSTIILSLAVTVVYVKKRKRNTETNS